MGLGRYHEAEKFIERNQLVHLQINERHFEECEFLSQRIEIYLAVGSYDKLSRDLEALRDFDRSLLDSSSNSWNLLSVLWVIANLSRIQENFSAAILVHEEATQFIKDRDWMNGFIMSPLARKLYLTHLLGTARVWIDYETSRFSPQGITSGQQEEEKEVPTWVHEKLYGCIDGFSRAEELILECLELFIVSSSGGIYSACDAGGILHVLGMLELRQGDLANAQLHLYEALDLFKHWFGNPEHPYCAQVEKALGEVWLKRREMEKAAVHLRSASVGLTKSGINPMQEDFRDLTSRLLPQLDAVLAGAADVLSLGQS